MSGDDIVERLRNHSKRSVGCDCVRCEAATEIVRLRAALAAIDALPDEGPFHLDVRNNGYSYAMRQVKALLHPEEARRG